MSAFQAEDGGSIPLTRSIYLITLSWMKDFILISVSGNKKNMLDKKIKQKIIKKFRTHADDTGSTQIQIAILTKEIEDLTLHLQEHKQDHSSRRGLLRKVNERRKLLKYLQKEDENSFKDVTIKLKLKIGKKLQAEEDERRRLEQEELALQEIKPEEK